MSGFDWSYSLPDYLAALKFFSMMEWSKHQTILILLGWEFIGYYSLAVFSGPARQIGQIDRGGAEKLFLIDWLPTKYYWNSFSGVFWSDSKMVVISWRWSSIRKTVDLNWWHPRSEKCEVNEMETPLGKVCGNGRRLFCRRQGTIICKYVTYKGLISGFKLPQFTSYYINLYELLYTTKCLLFISVNTLLSAYSLISSPPAATH